MKNKLQVLPLYGELDVEEQQLAVEDTTSSKLKVVLATNLAETSITLKDCSVVIDVGLIKFKSGYALVTLQVGVVTLQKVKSCFLKKTAPPIFDFQKTAPGPGMFLSQRSNPV